MAFELIPQRFWTIPHKLSSIMEEEDWSDFLPSVHGGVSISEDEQHVYVEAPVAGVDPADVEVTFDKGVLWIKAEAKEEEKNPKKKYYRKASRSYSYRVFVPGELDQNKEPGANIDHGMVQVVFDKAPQTQPKK